MIGAFNRALGLLFAALFYPFRGMSPWVAMAIVSVLTALVMLVAFRYTSNQEGIRRIKARIQAHLLELRLYKDSLRTTFASQGKILACLPRYIGYSTVPVLVMIVPLVLMIVHLDLWFGYEHLKPGETAILKVKLRDGVKPTAVPVAAEAPPGLAIDTPAVRIDSEGEVDWRLRAVAPGVHDVVVTVGGERLTKEVAVGGPLMAVSEARVGGSVLDELLNPGEPALRSGSEVTRVEVAYPPGRMSLFGWYVHWLVPFFLLSIVFGYALKGFFKIEV